MTGLKVWIDQDLCTGDGICVEICPELFGMHSDGLAYVKEAFWPDIANGAKEPVHRMSQGQASVPSAQEQTCIEAAEECPGECIFLEVVD